MSDVPSAAPLDYRRLFAALPGLYLILSPNLAIMDASDAYLEATMTRREDIVGHDIFDVFPDNPADAGADGVSNLRASLMRVRQTRAGHTMAVQRYDIRRPATAGGGFEERFWSPHNAPALDAEGTLWAIVHRVEDVTAYVRLQRAERERLREVATLRDRAVHMEAEIFQRAQEIARANRELEGLNASLRRMQEGKDLLTGMLVHDLRNPLTALQGNLELLAGEQMDASAGAARHLARAQDAAQRQMELVNGIIDVMRMEDGDMVVRMAEVDVTALVISHLDQYQGAAARSGITLDRSRLPAGLSGHTDGTLLGRVLDNLISNAIKHTPRGGRVSVRVDVISAPQPSMILVVSDTGEGIAPDQLTRLFHKYGRIEGQQGGRAYDTGLGLLFCRMAAERLGGSITVTSQPHQGSTFTVTIPNSV